MSCVKYIFRDKINLIISARETNHPLLNLDELFSLGETEHSNIYPDFDKLYALNKKHNRITYTLFMNRYLETISASYPNQEEERRKTIKNLNEKMDILNKLSCKDVAIESDRELDNILNMSNCDLRVILYYDRRILPMDKEEITALLDYIIKSKTFINKLNITECDFSKVLNFILDKSVAGSVPIGAYLAEKILMNDGKYNESLAQKIKVLPAYLFEYLKDCEDPINNDDIKYFISHINDIDLNTCIEYANCLNMVAIKRRSQARALVKNQVFLSLRKNQKCLILDKLTDLKNELFYKKTVYYLFSPYDSSGSNAFLLNISEDYFSSIFKFVLTEKDEAVLDAKLEVLNRIKSQIKDHSVSVNVCDSCLNSLDTEIKELNPEDKIKYLDAHSKFFEKNSLEDFSRKMKFRDSSSSYKNKVLEELGKNKKYKRLKNIFKFASFYDDQYGIAVAGQIVDQLVNCQTK